MCVIVVFSQVSCHWNHNEGEEQWVKKDRNNIVFIVRIGYPVLPPVFDRPS